MARRSWLITSRGFAERVKNATLAAPQEIKDYGATLQCPNCNYVIDNSDVAQEWPGLPSGVKFDPSDIELLEHLATKIGVGSSNPHVMIDDFIPTLENDDGIFYTHPENLPGAKKDGSRVHFFYRTMNAHASGQRKRRRINGQKSTIGTHVRWHKTGKTKPVMENGIQKGCKKIMVLYSTSKKGSKSDNCHWVMHQYNLGTHDDERGGQYVVSKIFYQPQKATDWSEASSVIEESDLGTVQMIPRTPKTNSPDPPRLERTPLSDVSSDDYAIQSFVQKVVTHKESSTKPDQLRKHMEHQIFLDRELKAVDFTLQASPLCKERIDSYPDIGDPKQTVPLTQVAWAKTDTNQRDDGATCGISDLENLEMETPPDFAIADLQFASQDSLFDCLDLW